MLDMGFIHDVRRILGWLPAQKQTLFFSATMPPEVQGLVDSLLHNPAKVAVNPISSPVEVIDQKLYYVDRGNKTRLLAALIRELDVKNALVFTRTKHGANKVAGDLVKAGISAAAIHGNKSQTARQQALADFKSGAVQVLVATDIAARGLDIEALGCVFNYNLPEVPETYVHRIGRTGRAGKDGIAISFCDFGEKPLLRDIEKLIGKQVPVVEDHPFPMQVFEAPKKDARGRIVNPEDAEARKAAKAKKAASQQGQKEQKASKAQVSKPAPETKQPKQAKAPKASKKPEPLAPLAVEERPSDIKLPGQRTYKRPERKPLSALDEIAPALPPEEMPQPKYGAKRTGHLRNTFFTPEEQKKYGGEPEPFMDATARLFASRKPIPARYQEPEQQEGQGKKKGKKGGKAVQGQPAPAKQEQAKPEEAQAGQAKKKRKKKKKSPAQAQPKPQNQGTPAVQARLLTPTKQKKRSRRDRPPMQQRSIYAAHKKDSTEQEGSLMKPYYLSDD